MKSMRTFAKKPVSMLLAASVCLIGPQLSAIADEVSAINMNEGNSFEWVGEGRPDTKWNTVALKGGPATIPWYFNPNNIDPALTADNVLTVIKMAQANWEGVCNIKFDYKGTTTASPKTFGDGRNVIGFIPLDSGSYSRSAATVYGYKWTSITSWFTEADIYVYNNLSSAIPTGKLYSAFQGLITHELGHMLGLDHSNVSESIMYAQPYHDFDYQQTIRTDDAAGCISKYGKSLKSTSLAFNTFLASPLKPTSTAISSVVQDKVAGSQHSLTVTFDYAKTKIPSGKYMFLFAQMGTSFYSYNAESKMWYYIPNSAIASDNSIQHAATSAKSNAAGQFSIVPIIWFPDDLKVGTNIPIFLGYGDNIGSMVRAGTYKQSYTIIK